MARESPTSNAARNYAAAIAELRRRGVSMSVNDAYIAATAVPVGAALWTRNIKDFQQYPGIRLHDPWG